MGSGTHQPSGLDPIALHDVELTRPLPALSAVDAQGERYRRAQVLVRIHSKPIGVATIGLGDAGLSPERLAAEISGQLGRPLAEHLRADGLDGRSAVDAGGLPAVSEPRCLAPRRAALNDPPPVSVLVVTRNRSDVVGRCLRSLEALDYPRFEVILVDSSTDEATAEIARSQFPAVNYLRIDSGGLCVARNRGLAAASGEIIAFTDDDAVVDQHWLAEHVAAIRSSEDVACTTGLVLALELRTPAQLWFEESGAFVEGFGRREISLEQREPGSLLPFATGRIGAGVNMAWRAAALRELGDFDLALDETCADDLALFFDALCAGSRIVYEPGAIVFHEHRRTYDELRRQIFWHAVGLGAYMTRCLVTQPARLPDFLRRLPRGIRYGFFSSSPRNRKKGTEFPPELTRIELQGVIRGPYAYLKGRRKARAAGDERSAGAGGGS